jgi:arsenite transporter
MHQSICAAAGLLVMMYPILCKVRYESLHQLFQASSQQNFWKQIVFSVVVNWIVAPLVMVSPRQRDW